MRKPPPTTADLGIEPVTQYRAAAEPYSSNVPKCNGGGARLIPISLPRVRWLERPEAQADEQALAASH